jgi:hypothetical protein
MQRLRVFLGIGLAGVTLIADLRPGRAAEPCVDGGKIATVAEFSDGSTLRILDRTADTLRYEVAGSKAGKSTVTVKNGFFTLSTETGAESNTFQWQGDLDGIVALKQGAKHRASAVIKRGDGAEAQVEAEIAIGPSEVITVEGCPYPTVQVTVVNEVKSAKSVGKSMVLRSYHAKSMLTLRTVVFRFLESGAPEVLATYNAVSLK